MKLYLDVSCLNRPFDDQTQARIRLESEAVTLILDECDHGEWQQLSSEIATIEIDATPDADRRKRVRHLLPQVKFISALTEDHFERGGVLEKLGFKPADALHVAAAEFSEADVLLSCDDSFCKVAKRNSRRLHVRVANPVDWLREVGHGLDAE